MVKINDNYLLLESSYLFSEIERRLNEFAEENPDLDIIKMGIGDVTKPLSKTVVKAFKEAVDEMANEDGFHGYGPEQGYAFLRETLVEKVYKPLGVDLTSDEIFISDGAKCDSGNIQELFSIDSKVGVTDPVYPVYVDTNVMAGRAGPANYIGHYEGLVYIPCVEENGFIPEIPKENLDLVYLCSPNNPTGTALTKDDLSKWVEYAKENDAIILFDAAYEAFITEDDVPHSIYEIEGAKEVAIEFRSFSKTAGFTGTRCAFTVVPKELVAEDSEGNEISMNSLWNRRQTTKFNGVSYPVQVAANAVYSEAGAKETKENIDSYLENAKIIRESLSKIGLTTFGGVNSPYIWIKNPNNMDSWEFFDLLLKEANIVTTPGSGFGPCGEGYIRLTAFNTLENTKKAMERIRKLSFE